MKVTGRGLYRDASGEYLLIRPALDNEPPDTLSRHDFFLSRRYFFENLDEGVLSGSDLFLAPHWKSLYGETSFTIDWFPQVKEFEITKMEEE